MQIRQLRATSIFQQRELHDMAQEVLLHLDHVSGPDKHNKSINLE